MGLLPRGGLITQSLNSDDQIRQSPVNHRDRATMGKDTVKRSITDNVLEMVQQVEIWPLKMFASQS